MLSATFWVGARRRQLTVANQDVRTWCITTAGRRIHGTTREQPLVRFETTGAGAAQRRCRWRRMIWRSGKRRP